MSVGADSVDSADSEDSVDILGVRVHRVTMTQAVEAVTHMLSDGGHHQVVTLNATMLYQATRDAGFRRLVNSASLVTPDGMGTMLVARVLGTPLPEKVSGVDLVDRLCAACAEVGFRVFFFGAGPGIAEVAAGRLRAKYPRLQIAGLQHGYYDPRQEPSMVEAVRSAQTQLLLVALGSPRQEDWISMHLRECGAIVGIGVGGSLDVYAGRARLAPQWIRRVGLEWAYRLAREPRRWRVVLTLPLVVLLAIKERVRRLARGNKSTRSPRSSRSNEHRSKD